MRPQPEELAPETPTSTPETQDESASAIWASVNLTSATSAYTTLTPTAVLAKYRSAHEPYGVW